jgi:hypothetical protein
MQFNTTQELKKIMATIKLPEVLYKFANSQKIINIEANNLTEISTYIKNQFPELYKVTHNKQGEMSGFINLFSNAGIVESDESIDTDAELELIVSVSGG